MRKKMNGDDNGIQNDDNVERRKNFKERQIEKQSILWVSQWIGKKVEIALVNTVTTEDTQRSSLKQGEWERKDGRWRWRWWWEEAKE